MEFELLLTDKLRLADAKGGHFELGCTKMRLAPPADPLQG